jgi:hypothetical protein
MYTTTSIGNPFQLKICTLTNATALRRNSAGKCWQILGDHSLYRTEYPTRPTNCLRSRQPPPPHGALFANGVKPKCAILRVTVRGE